MVSRDGGGEGSGDATVDATVDADWALSGRGKGAAAPAPGKPARALRRKSRLQRYFLEWLDLGVLSEARSLLCVDAEPFELFFTARRD